MNDVTDRLLAALRTRGAARSRDLQEATGSSQATVSRGLAPLLKSGAVLRVGRARNQAYVMPRVVPGIGSPIVPVMKVDSEGAVSRFGTLIPAAGGRYWMDEEFGAGRLHDGLPWFLADMRPQGFLGRSFAHANSALGFAPNPDQWTDDDVLRALCHAGDDLPGNLIVGSTAFERHMHGARQPAVSAAQYAKLADAAMQGALPGSSAGGDQPKFCAVAKGGQPVIVKFSPPGKAAADQRWADLLACEHIALRSLESSGIPAARSRILRAGNRTLLEVRRFDRTPRGRIGMVSLLSYDSEYIGQIDNWAAAAERMAARGLLSDRDARTLRFVEAFGRLIGNTDRHYGNVSLLIEDGVTWRLAPVYDMLPMVYAPVAGEIVQREFDPGALQPTTETVDVWPAARLAARQFWDAVANDDGVSAAFRTTARRHAKQLKS